MMASYAPIAFVAPQYEQINYWIKGYLQGTTTPLAMATDASAGTTLAKAEIGNDGYIKTAGGAKFIPHFNADYDLYLFPTAADADANNTASAIQVADNIAPSIDANYANFRGWKTIAEWKNDASVTAGQWFYATGRPAPYEVVNVTANAEDGGSRIKSAGNPAVEFVAEFGTQIDIAQWAPSLDGITNDSVHVNSAIAYCFSNSIRELHGINGTCYCPDAITSRGEVIFYGTGKFTGDGMYRVLVHTPDEPISQPSFCGDFDPDRHLIQFKTTDTPKVVFMGDSLLTLGAANALGRQGMLADIIARKLQAENPQKTITFVNRSIAGETYATANDVPITFPSWYTVTTDPWLDYISTEAPDLVVLSFGMNDAAAFSYFSFQQVIGKIRLFTKVPDIIVCTPMVPTTSPHANYVTYGTKDIGQVSRDWNAGYTRNYCRANHIGLIDINRAFGIIRDGRDICESYLEQIETSLDVSATGSYIATTDNECSDFRVDFTLEGTAGELEDMFDGTLSKTLAVKIDGGYFGYGRLVLTSLNNSNVATSNIWARVYLTDTVTIAGGDDGVDTGIAIPTTNTTFIVERRGQRLTIRKTDSSYNDELYVLDEMSIHGGEFAPSVGWYEDAYAAGPVSTVSVAVGRYRKYQPVLTNQEIWGTPAATAATQQPYGGNGVNHPTSLGAMVVYSAVMTGLSFRTAYGAIQIYDSKYSNSRPYMASRMPDSSIVDHTVIGDVEKSLYLMAAGIARVLISGDILSPIDDNTAHLGSVARTWAQCHIQNLYAYNLPTYADNAAALAGGRTAGFVYKTATGSILVVY